VVGWSWRGGQVCRIALSSEELRAAAMQLLGHAVSSAAGLPSGAAQRGLVWPSWTFLLHPSATTEALAEPEISNLDLNTEMHRKACLTSIRASS